MKKHISSTLCLLFLSTSLMALDFKVGLEPMLSTAGSYNQFHFFIGHNEDNFEFITDVSMLNDGKYDWGLSNFFWDYYFFINNGGIKLNFPEISFETGKLNHHDEVQSPYSLFISSKPLPAFIANFRYENDVFFYQTRWVRLNKNPMAHLTEDMNKHERGMNYQVYGLKLDSFRFGFQQAIVYHGRYFDEEFFLNPVPNFLVQYMNNSAGTPWAQEDANYNSIMGFFADYTATDYYVYAQLLIDDFNANRFLDRDSYQNPDKIAFSLGGNKQTPYGLFGAYAALSTRHNFQTSGARDYGYVYYPFVEYDFTGNYDYKEIAIEDNYIGYYHGESNLAFMLDFTYTLPYDIHLFSSAEYVVSGGKSPANAWFQYKSWRDEPKPGTSLFGTDVLEHQFNFNVKLEHTYKAFDYALLCRLQYIRNKQSVQEVPEELTVNETNDKSFLLPEQGTHHFQFDLGVRLSFSF